MTVTCMIIIVRVVPAAPTVLTEIHILAPLVTTAPLRRQCTPLVARGSILLKVKIILLVNATYFKTYVTY